MNTPADSAVEAVTKPEARSRVTNGAVLLPGIDGRSTWVRRCRDLIELHTSDLGGADAVSVAESAIVRRAAVIVVELEQMELSFAKGQASANDLDLYQRTSNSLRRLLESLGLKRRPRRVDGLPLLLGRDD